MKHISTISRRPAQASDLTGGQILKVIVSILSVLADALLAKEEASA